MLVSYILDMKKLHHLKFLFIILIGKEELFKMLIGIIFLLEKKSLILCVII